MDNQAKFSKEKSAPLRRGWTTGACATAAAKSALCALIGKGFADPVQITLPGGQTPSFVLAHERAGPGFAEAGIVKDAGDDPDVTHGAMIIARVEKGARGTGIVFCAGKGVGRITRPGLPLEVGEPAINPVPRKMICQALDEVCTRHRTGGDFKVTISVPQGEKIALKTWNPRLGIVGGISILGTSGIVIPYSCSAWIHSIRSGIDVARAAGLNHIAGATGKLSEKAARDHFDLPEQALIDMGDFVGGMLKYLRANPVQRVSIAGGFAKMSKLAQGAMDLHSTRSQVDRNWLAGLLEELGADEAVLEQVAAANTANEILQISRAGGFDLAGRIADRARIEARAILKHPETDIDVLIVDRNGQIAAASLAPQKGAKQQTDGTSQA